jgi:DNA-binding NarL/FixJ family response regulator
VKTVEGHLANAYGKLDIRSRTQLPQVLDPRGQVAGAVA